MTERIDSPGNKKIKLAASLHHRKTRDKEGLFIVEGVRLAEMAAASSWEIVFGLCTRTAAAEPRVQKILAALAARQCPVYEIDEDIYKKAAATVAPQGLLLVMKQQQTSLRQVLSAEEQPLLLVLDGLQDPGNAGTMIRTADAAGCSGVVFLTDTVDLFSDKTVRSTMGSLFHLPIAVQVERQDLLAALQAKKVRLLVTALDETACQHFAVDYREGAAVAFGNEGNGVSQELLAAAEKKLYIPMLGEAESLNAATAAAVVLYEALRQRIHSQ